MPGWEWKETSTNIEIGENSQESSEKVSEQGYWRNEVPDKIICDICEIPFVNSRIFKMHYRKNHSLADDNKSKYFKYFKIEDELITCRKCQGTFSKPKKIFGIELMKKHMNSFLKEATYVTM